MKITKEWLRKKDACPEGYEWWSENCNHLKTIKEQIKVLSEYNFEWAIWVLIKIMNKRQNLRFAIYCAKLVLPIFEKKYPADNRPGNAIKAAEKVLERNTKKNRNTAAYAAFAAADADTADWTAVWAAARAAARAARAANADPSIKNKIINYSLRLINN